jgi:hypothetical protein
MAVPFEEIRAVIDQQKGGQQDERPAEPVRPDREPGARPGREPGNTPEVPEAERPPEGEEGVASGPDFTARH